MNRGPIGRVLGAVAGTRLRQLGIATLMLALLGGIGIATAAPKTIDDFGLAANGRGWDLDDDTFGVGDGSIVAGRAGSDAFDGGLQLYVDGNDFGDSNGEGNYVRKRNSLRVGPEPTGDLRVSRTETARGPYLRSLVRLKNNQNTPFVGTITWASNLGSDSSEVTRVSSAGSPSNFTKGDRWLVSSEPGANDWGNDPVLGFVLWGKGARERVDTVLSAPGGGSVNVDFEDLRVPKNNVRYMLFFTEMHPAAGRARKSIRKYDRRGLSRGLLKGIPPKVRNRVVNWNL